MLRLQTSEEVQRDKSMPAHGDRHPVGYVLRRLSELKVTLSVCVPQTSLFCRPGS